MLLLLVASSLAIFLVLHCFGVSATDK